jgi:hypothetical protein
LKKYLIVFSFWKEIMGSISNGAGHANGALGAALDITVLGLNSGTSMVYQSMLRAFLPISDD